MIQSSTSFVLKFHGIKLLA